MSIRALSGFALSAICCFALASPASASGSKVFNVKTYGATGNGSTDDTNAIQQALNAAAQRPGSVVLFPDGNYLYSKTITATSVRLQGSRQSTLTGSGTLQQLVLQGDGVGASNLSFTTSVTDDIRSDVVVQNANGFTLQNLIFNQHGDVLVGVTLNSCSNGKLTNNAFNLTGLASQAVALTSCNHVQFSLNSVMRGTGAIFTSCTACGAQNNVFTDCLYGIQISKSTGFVASKNTMSGVKSSGISMSSSTDVTADSNTIGNALASISSIESSLNTNVLLYKNKMDSVINSQLDQRVRVQANTISGGKVGITISEAANPSVEGNTISRVGGEGISAVGCTGTVSISGNILSNCGARGTFTYGKNARAVIYVNSGGAGSIPINNNSYTGSTTLLQYFIECIQPSPPASISGNTTNTMLPNFLG